MIKYLKTVKDIDGDFAEFGVHAGNNFMRILREAKIQNKTAHAFDSFEGFAEPTPQDTDPKGECHYEKGSMKMDVDRFSMRLKESKKDNFIIHKGFLPESLETESGLVLSFSHVDLDHYFPTLKTLEWIWGHTSEGGLILCHDWYPKKTWEASLAIKHFMEEFKIKPIRDNSPWILFIK